MIKEYLERQFKKYHTITSGYVTPEMFGAVGDGTTDDGVALTKAINKAQSNRLILRLFKNYYSSTVITIPSHVIVEGNSIAPTAVTNQIPKTWNIKSPNGVKITSHTTIRNVGFNETTLEINGSRNQIESCVFINCDRALYLHNTTSENWVGEEYIHNCYFYDCVQGVYNNAESPYPVILDSEISGCTAINDRKLATTNALTNDTFMTGRFVAMRVIDNHLYASAVAKDCTFKDCLFEANYFDNVFPYFIATLDGKLSIQNNIFFTSGVNPNWDKASDYHVNEFTKATSGNRKWLIFDGNQFIMSTYNATDTPLMEQYYHFVHTTNKLAINYTNNVATIQEFSSDDATAVRYILADYLKYGITYNGKTLNAIRSLSGIAISGVFTMPASYSSSADVYGTQNIPSSDYNTRFYATLVYKDSNSETKKATVYVKLIGSNGSISIEKAPSDYASDGTLYINTVLVDYQYNPTYAQV